MDEDGGGRVSEIKLKKCPFCGEEVAIRLSNDIPPSYGIEHFCGQNTRILIKLKWKKNKKEVIDAWNRRVFE